MIRCWSCFSLRCAGVTADILNPRRKSVINWLFSQLFAPLILAVTYKSVVGIQTSISIKNPFHSRQSHGGACSGVQLDKTWPCLQDQSCHRAPCVASGLRNVLWLGRNSKSSTKRASCEAVYANRLHGSYLQDASPNNIQPLWNNRRWALSRMGSRRNEASLEPSRCAYRCLSCAVLSSLVSVSLRMHDGKNGFWGEKHSGKYLLLERGICAEKYQ